MDAEAPELAVPLSPEQQARLGALFKHYYDRLCAYACRWGTRRLPDAEDAVQDAFVLLSLHPVLDVPGDHRPLGYLHLTIRGRMMNGARNLATDRRQHTLHRDDIQAALGPIPCPTPLDQLVSAEWYTRLDAAIETLPPRSQQIVRLRLAGYSYLEIAEELGITTGTINTLVVRAYQALRKALVADGPLLEGDA
jgi:RNA polymerase sigma factor (sigma-70 family)